MNNSQSGGGYKQPPPHTRFPPGRSGNPSGRPKHRPSFRAALLSELASSMPGKDQQRAGTKLQALVRTLVDAAIAGDGRAQSMLIGLLERIGEVDAYVSGELKRHTNESDAVPAPDKDRVE
jgi:Family of unknown function (DUF5681)